MNFKDLMKNEIENKLKDHRQYFSREDLRYFIPNICLSTFNKYLVDLCKEGVLQRAGRGWYSFISQPFELDQRPVKKIISVMEKKYPLLSFSIWSTEQLKSFVHHMLARFVTFVYVDRDAMAGVCDLLKDLGFDVWLNPRGNDVQKFSIGAKTVVIRSAITRQPSSGHVADIEKILVDLLVEISDLKLMDENEYSKILGNVLAAGRIDVGAMLNYARRRKLETRWLIEQIKSI